MVTHRQLSDDDPLPLLVEPDGGSPEARALSDFADGNRDWIDEHLYRHGAILFRGFGITEDAQLEQVSRSLTPELKLYVEGNSPREHTSDFVYTSTSYPAEYDISMHNELSYAHSPPKRLFFNCQIPPATGGETPLVDSRRLLEWLDPEVVKRFEAHGIRYVQNVHGGAGLGRSWQETFETKDREEVDRYLASSKVESEWDEAGNLRTRQVRPAVRTHEETGERVWFNQADQWHPTNLDEETRQAMVSFLDEEDYPLNATFGDGSPIPEEDLDHIRSVMWNRAVRYPWQRGDLLVVDNFLVAHGRCSFTGERAIRVAMG